jgi:hypothetical protein
MACCVCVLVCPAAKLPSEVDGSKYVPSRRRRPLAATRAAGRQACRRQTRTFPPCCCCCNKHNVNDCAMRTLYDAHHWCAAARWARPPSPTPHTHTCIYIYILWLYSIIQYNRTPHWPAAAAAAASHHPPPRRRSRPTISAQYYIEYNNTQARNRIRRHVDGASSIPEGGEGSSSEQQQQQKPTRCMGEPYTTIHTIIIIIYTRACAAGDQCTGCTTTAC